MDRDNLVEMVARVFALEQDGPKIGDIDYWKPEARKALFRAARAALAIIEPCVREECAVSCETLEWGKDISWWLHATKKDVAAESGHQCAAAIRAGAKP